MTELKPHQSFKQERFSTSWRGFVELGAVKVRDGIDRIGRVKNVVSSKLNETAGEPRATLAIIVSREESNN